MPSALDTFRAQQEAADSVYARLQEVAGLLHELRKQTDALQRTDELKQLLEREERWLGETRQAVNEVRRWRENRSWRSALTRWAGATMFGIGAAAAAGCSYAWATRPWNVEIENLRTRVAVTEFLERRYSEMSPSERRELDKLLRWNPHPNGR